MIQRYIALMTLTCSSLFASMEHFPGTAKESLIPRTHFSLLTWNILGLPNDQVPIRPWQERIDGIANLILGTDADVVILQECFEKALSLSLHERLKHRYAHAYLHLEEGNTPLPSGLALFSKLPIDQLRFTPHPDLLDTERNAAMGICDFLILDAEKRPIAHIAGCHFQGSSNCAWRVGLTQTGLRLSYSEVRQQEAKAALDLLGTTENLPQYLCGDLNVDRRSTEFYTSTLNSQINRSLIDHMTPVLRMHGTNTSFWKHVTGLSRMYPTLSQEEILALAKLYKTLYEDKLVVYLAKAPWNQPLSQFDASQFAQLEREINLESSHQKMVWDYFVIAALQVVAQEKELWQNNHNTGDAPPASIGQVLIDRACPIEESLDYILGTNPSALVEHLKILRGYDQSVKNTLSDHHPLYSVLKVLAH